jgi:hypothetical protein
MKTLEELDALHAAATAGPWAVEDDGESGWRVWTAEHLREGPDILAFDDGSAYGEYSEQCTPATRDAIIALHNAWPEVSARLRAAEALVAKALADNTPRPLDEWHEDDGPVLWWRLPVKEPPYAGTPLDDDWPVCATHWTRLHVPAEARAALGGT